MSYTIFYRSLFVKTADNKFIPIIESGDNNVWEAGNTRRARSWCNAGWMAKESHLLTAEEIMAEVERMIDSVKQQYANKPKPEWEHEDGIWTEKDVEQRFGYFEGIAISGGHCNNTTAQQLRNFFRKGIENAVSVGDIDLDVHWCTEYPNYEHRYATNEAELLAAIKEGKDGGHRVWIGFAFDYAAERILQRQAAERKAQRKPAAPKQKGYAVTINDYFVAKATTRRFFTNFVLDGAHVYGTRAAAEKLQQRILRNRYTSQVYEVRMEDGKWKIAA